MDLAGILSTANTTEVETFSAISQQPGVCFSFLLLNRNAPKDRTENADISNWAHAY